MRSAFAIAIAIAFLGPTALAAPRRVPQITVAVKNEFTGETALATVPANGDSKRLPDLFTNSNINEGGQILATSAQLIRFVDNVFCSFNSHDIVIPLNSTTPLVDLDGNPNVALLEPVLLNNFQFQCQV